MPILSPAIDRRTSGLVPAPLFDHRLRNLRRDRAARKGIEPFLFDRAFDECLQRLGDIRSEFRDVLLAGCPVEDWPLRIPGKHVSSIDPGSQMARTAGGTCADLESLPFAAGQFDLVLTVGLLDTANDLALAATAMHLVLKPGGLLLGAIVGGDSFPRLRQAMLAADSIAGSASPHVHPRIEGPALARLLTECGFTMPVVDVDRVEIGYRSLDSLVSDLRAMGGTNILLARSRRALGRSSLTRAREAFMDGAERVVEQVDILHFAAWKAD